MHLLKMGSFFWCECVSGFSQEGIDEESAAHANSPVNAPNGELDTGFLEGLAPSENMLIDAVDQRAIEVEEERQVGRSPVFGSGWCSCAPALRLFHASMLGHGVSTSFFRRAGIGSQNRCRGRHH
jgi:hypothetical protein